MSRSKGFAELEDDGPSSPSSHVSSSSSSSTSTTESSATSHAVSGDVKKKAASSKKDEGTSIPLASFNLSNAVSVDIEVHDGAVRLLCVVQWKGASES